MDKNQEEFYKKTMVEAKKKIRIIDEEMQKIVEKTREALEKLQDSKSSFQQVYEGAAKLLGITLDPESPPEKYS